MGVKLLMILSSTNCVRITKYIMATANAHFEAGAYVEIKDSSWKSTLKIASSIVDFSLWHRYALWFPTKEQALLGGPPLLSEIFPLIGNDESSPFSNILSWISRTGINKEGRSSRILLKLDPDYKFYYVQSLPKKGRFFNANDVIPNYKTKTESIESQIARRRFGFAGLKRAGNEIESFSEVWGLAILKASECPHHHFENAIDISTLYNSKSLLRRLHPIASKPLPLP